MTEYVDIYCPGCDAEVHACLRNQPAILSVRGEEVGYSETVAVCPTCGEIIGDARIEGSNLERAYDAYRTLHGILSPGEVKTLRHSYGLSLREFSKFLGFGEQTTYRYEHGDIPDQPHNTTMLSARTIEGARLLLTQNRGKLSARSIARIEQRMQAMVDGAAERTRLLDVYGLAGLHRHPGGRGVPVVRNRGDEAVNLRVFKDLAQVLLLARSLASPPEDLLSGEVHCAGVHVAHDGNLDAGEDRRGLEKPYAPAFLAQAGDCEPHAVGRRVGAGRASSARCEKRPGAERAAKELPS